MESLMTEEWMLSNVLSSTDLYTDDLQGYSAGDGVSFVKPHSHDQLLNPDDSGFNDDFDSWLTEATSIGRLDDGLGSAFMDAPVLVEEVNPSLLEADEQVAKVLAELEAAWEPSLVESAVGSFEAQARFLMEEPKLPASVAPSSPVEFSAIQPSFSGEPVVKYLGPSTIDTSGLSQQSQIVIDEMNVLHLPEDPAALMLLKALAEGQLVETSSSLDSSPPSSPEALVPASPESLSDDEYVPTRKRKAASSPAGSRSLKALKPVEKKERKKVQNKNAATKYRLKKRSEDQDVKQELTQLENKNGQLKRRVEDLNSEIVYMKGLLNEVLKGRGLRIK